jgi:hypothetical protein
MVGRKTSREVPLRLAKLRLLVNADSGEIIAHSLTDQETGHASQLEPLMRSDR